MEGGVDSHAGDGAWSRADLGAQGTHAHGTEDAGTELRRAGPGPGREEKVCLHMWF